MCQIAQSIVCLTSAFSAWARLGEEWGGVAAGVGGDRVDEVGVQAAALQAAGGVGGEEAFDAALAGLGLAAEAELAVDDGAAQRALGVVVGRLDPAVVGEGPE